MYSGYGRHSAELGSVGAWDRDTAVDPHRYLLGRERDVDDKEAIFGRQPGDSESLFPRFTSSSAASTGQATVNGKTIHLWTYGQLETLKAPVLRQRAAAIRDAVGEANCPPMPSAQPQDLVRWILHMQSEITQDHPETGRTGHGSGNVVPTSFAQDAKERPISMNGYDSPQKPHVPFGPGRRQDHAATRDNYHDLKHQRNDFAEDKNEGIVSRRHGGEGRRHLHPETNMVSFGVSSVEKPLGGEGRRYLGCSDHLMEQKQELVRDPTAGGPSMGGGGGSRPGTARGSDAPAAHVSNCHFERPGVPHEGHEAPIGGERRRHVQQQSDSRMLNVGTADPGHDESRIGGRKKLDCFAGSKFSQSHEHGGYQSNWKKDPSRLKGTSLIC